MFPRVNSFILVHRPRETRTSTHKQLGRCCARCSCPQVWTKQEGALWQEGTMLSAQLALQAMLRVPLLGHVALTNPTPSRHVPLLTSVKKPAIPAWHEPCSSPYFFLYSGGEKGRKKKNCGHPWHSTRSCCLHCYTAWRDISTPRVLPMDQPPLCTMAASSPASGVKQGARK